MNITFDYTTRKMMRIENIEMIATSTERQSTEELIAAGEGLIVQLQNADNSGMPSQYLKEVSITLAEKLHFAAMWWYDSVLGYYTSEAEKLFTLALALARFALPSDDKDLVKYIEGVLSYAQYRKNQLLILSLNAELSELQR